MQLETLVREFLFECEIREYTPRTVENYKKQLRHFTEFLKEYCSVETLEEVQASHVVPSQSVRLYADVSLRYGSAEIN